MSLPLKFKCSDLNFGGGMECEAKKVLACNILGSDKMMNV